MNRNLNTIFTLFAVVCICLAGFVAATEAYATERTLPAGTTGLTEVVEATASQTTLIQAPWPSASITVLQGNGVTEDFRAAIGTSTISTDLPLIDNFSVSFRSGGFVAVRTATATAKLVVYYVKE